MAKESIKNIKNENAKGKNSVVNKKNDSKKKSVKKVNDNKENVKVYEKLVCFVVGVIVVLLFVSMFKSTNFIPAFLISLALELFCIFYYYIEDETKKKLVYGLFITGVILIVIALVYTIVNIS